MIKPNKQTYQDTLNLTAGHSLMLSNVPSHIYAGEVANLNLQKLNADFPKFSNLKETKSSFGLFSVCDYGSYYPEVSADDLKPKDEDFVEPLFRLLSATTVAKQWLPTEFPEKVLKESLGLLKGQTVYLDHDDSVGNSIGVVSDTVWQDSFKQDGVTIPAGINGVLKIDGKSNPRIARGVMMNPPSIHSNSVTVVFNWEPSHEFEDVWEFYDKLGTFTEDGELIRRIATKILRYQETSLVSHGADPFAQKVVGGMINNPVHAASLSMRENGKPDTTSINEFIKAKSYDVTSFKDSDILELKENNTRKSNIENKPNQNKTQNMEQFLANLFGEGHLSLAEGVEATEELALERVKTLIEDNLKLKTQVTSLQSENTTLQADKTQNLSLAAIGKNHLESLRNETLASYNKLSGEAANQDIINLISSEQVSVGTLVALKASYDVSLNEKFPNTCSKCGSHEISRASSIAEGKDGEDTTSNSVESPDDTIYRIGKNKTFAKQN